MIKRAILLVLTFSSVIVWDAQSQQPGADPLREAESILSRARRLSTSDLNVGGLARALPNVLAGRSGKGRINIRTIFIAFGRDGKTVSAWTRGRRTTEKPYRGTYTVRGNRITFVLGPSTFRGSIAGNIVSGTRVRSDGIRDTWKVYLGN